MPVSRLLTFAVAGVLAAVTGCSHRCGCLRHGHGDPGVAQVVGLPSAQRSGPYLVAPAGATATEEPPSAEQGLVAVEPETTAPSADDRAARAVADAAREPSPFGQAANSVWRVPPAVDEPMASAVPVPMSADEHATAPAGPAVVAALSSNPAVAPPLPAPPAEPAAASAPATGKVPAEPATPAPLPQSLQSPAPQPPQGGPEAHPTKARTLTKESVLPEEDPNCRYAHAADYSWVVGELRYLHTRKRWQVRFAPVEVEDAYGGSFLLTGVEHLMGTFHDGQIVKVSGAVLQPERRVASPVFWADTIKPLR